MEVKRHWEQFKTDSPGERFEDLYKRTHQPDVSPVVRFLFPAIGVLIVAAGLFLIPAPGPGSLILFLGLGLIATAIKPMAHWLDVGEVKARAGADKAKRFWSQASLGVKIVVSVLLMILLLGLGYGLYRLFWAK
jgi:uncharacterized protein (TIGR02611 family)